MSEQTRTDYREARSTDEPPSHWPSDVKPISITGFRFIGIDSKGRLYWDGNPIEIKQRIHLSRVQRNFTLFVGLLTAFGGLGAGLNNGFEFGCKQRFWTRGCSCEHTVLTSSPPIDRQLLLTQTKPMLGRTL